MKSGIWVVPNDIMDFINNQVPNDFISNVKYCGIFLGSFRKDFGLSLESLYHLKGNIQRFVVLKGKPLQKFLYGRNVNCTIQTSCLENMDPKKIVVMTHEHEPVGIAYFTVLSNISNNKITLELKSIVDLGLYLRKEQQSFA